MIKEDKIKIQGEVDLGTTIAYNDNVKGKMPLVLLIAGTGNLDRDGNSKVIKLNLYKDLSDHFVNQGCVCVRYDKRGTHESTGNYSKNSLTNLVDDAKTILDYCKDLPNVDSNRVIVCGHSEGTMIATLLSEKTDVDGLILLSGAGVSLKEAMHYQNDIVINEAKNGKGFLYWLLRKTAKPEKVHKQVEDIYKKAENCKKDRFFFQGAFLGTKYMQEHNSRTGDDYIEILRNYKGKVLAITGTKDLQVDYTKLDKLKDLENIETFSPEGVNHILREVDDNNSILNVQKQYKRLSKEPLHTKTMDFISNWLGKNFEREQSNERFNNASQKEQEQIKTSTQVKTKKVKKLNNEELDQGFESEL